MAPKTLNVVYAADTAEVGKALSEIESQHGSAFGKIAKLGAAAAAGLAAAAVGVGGLIAKTGVAMNASLETSTLQFETLMGDADMAKKHVEGLFKFAQQTPFETEPIITASKHLQTFGGTALNTEKSLKLVGDAAAATGGSIDEVGFWTGRAYSMIQGGKPFGEAAMRLQEMGILTPKAREEMEQLQKAGASSTEVWTKMEETLGKFDGAMIKQAGTWKGLTSTISDTLAIGAGEMTKPLFDAFKGVAQTLIDFSNSPGWAAIIAKGQVVFGGIGHVIEELTAAFQEGGIGGVLSETAQGIGSVASKIPGLGAFGIVFQVIGAVLQNVMPMLKELWGSFKQIFEALQPLVPIIATFLTQAISTLVPIIVELVNAIAPFLPQIVAIAVELVGALAPAVFAIIRAFMPLMPIIMKLIQTLLPPLLEIFRAISPLLIALTPLLVLIAELLSGAIGTALKLITPLLELLLKVFEGIVKAITAVVEWIGKLIKKFSDLDIPDWLKPGSPAPLETALKGIAGGMKAVERATPDELGFGVNARLNGNGALPSRGMVVEQHFHAHGPIVGPGGLATVAKVLTTEQRKLKARGGVLGLA